MPFASHGRAPGDERHRDTGANVRRILVIGPFPPRLDAAHGGSRAVAQLTLGLAERHSVRLLVLRREGEPATDPRLVDACDGVEEFRLPRLPGRGLEVWRRRVRLAAGVLACRPMWA